MMLLLAVLVAISPLFTAAKTTYADDKDHATVSEARHAASLVLHRLSEHTYPEFANANVAGEPALFYTSDGEAAAYVFPVKGPEKAAGYIAIAVAKDDKPFDSTGYGNGGHGNYSYHWVIGRGYESDINLGWKGMHIYNSWSTLTSISSDTIDWDRYKTYLSFAMFH